MKVDEGLNRSLKNCTTQDKRSLLSPDDRTAPTRRGKREGRWKKTGRVSRREAALVQVPVLVQERFLRIQLREEEDEEIR